MKKIFTLLFSINCLVSNAQIGGGWDWAFNTGSLGGTTFKHMKYNATGTEILMGGQALAAAYFGTNTLTAPAVLTNTPGQIKFFGKINSVTGASTIIRSFINFDVNFDCITTDDAGNFYIGGANVSSTTVDFGNGVSIPASTFKMAVIAKFDPTGTALWAKTFQMGAMGSANNQILKLAVSNAGNIFFWGFNPNSTTTTAPFNRNSPLYKLDNNGNTIWFKDALNNSSSVSNVNYSNFLADKFIDNSENVHLFVSTNSASGYTFDGIAYPGGTSSYSSTLISLNSSGTVTKAQTYEGGVSNFQVNRTNGNLLFGWNQFNANPGAFQNVPHPFGTVSPVYANAFTGMMETDKNLNFIKAKDYSTTIDNPFQATGNGVKFLSLPNGKLLITMSFAKTAAYYAGVNSVYPTDAVKYASAIIETDVNWNMDKFITGGKAPTTDQTYITAYNDTYLLGAGFYAEDVANPTSNPPLPTTSFGTVNLTGFNAASNFTTAYGVYSTSSSLRYDVAIAQTKSANFPSIASTTWLGITNNWNTASNWTNGVPTSSMKAAFTVPTPFYPTISSTPTAATLEINAGVTLPLPTTLSLLGGVKNDGTIVLNNTGFFQGLGSKEWKGTGSINFTGTSATFYYGSLFTNSLILNTDVSTQYSITIPSVTFSSGLFNLNTKKLTITNPSTTAVSGTSSTSYFYGGTLQRAISPNGVYEFAVGSNINFQSATISTNGLAGVGNIAVSHTSGAVTGTTPNTVFNFVPITSALNGGWFTITPDAQPSGGNYNVTLKIKGSTNTATAANRYTVVKRNDATSAWLVQGNYVLPTTDGITVTATNNGLTSFSDFAIGIGASSLPVSISGFTIKAINNTVELKWQTSTEINNKGFNVQHSIDGINFTSLGFVNGKGTILMSSNYSFTHFMPVNGNNYYRLQQVDNDGKHNFSATQMVQFNKASIALSVYPNPVVSSINFNKNFAAGTSIQIINQLGQIMEQGTINGNSYQPKKLPTGIYKVIVLEKDVSAPLVQTITVM